MNASKPPVAPPLGFSGPAPGFSGKVPARGDFLARRAPAGFGDTWQAWLAGLVLAAQAALGADWPDAWLTAPLWHFSLGREIVPPHGAIGVLVASVDRVGRFFPFSIIGSAAPGPHPNEPGQDAWARAAEKLALDALDDAFDPDALDAALCALGPPGSSSGTRHNCGHWPLILAEGWPAPACEPPADDQTAWWCRGSDRMSAVQLCCRGLPDDRLSAAMITGGFDAPG